jgi:prepilin-type processing-associated H-X9-DG protein
MSILAGDVNLAVSDWLVDESAGAQLKWTAAMHHFKGNVLFSDGHVEEFNNNGNNTLAESAELVLPAISPATGGNPSSTVPSGEPMLGSPYDPSPATNSEGGGPQTNPPAGPPPPVRAPGQVTVRCVTFLGAHERLAQRRSRASTPPVPGTRRRVRAKASATLRRHTCFAAS